MAEIRAENVERVAREVHELLRGSLDGGPPYRAQAYDDLDEHIKEANRQQELRARELLAELGYRVEQDDGLTAPPALDLTDEEIERASIAEHEGWMRQKTSAGYRFGPVCDDLTRTHPYLVPWEELTDAVRTSIGSACASCRGSPVNLGCECCGRWPRAAVVYTDTLVPWLSERLRSLFSSSRLRLHPTNFHLSRPLPTLGSRMSWTSSQNWTPDGGHVFDAGAKVADLDASATYPCMGAKRYQWLSPDGIGVRLIWVNCRAPGDALQFGRLYSKSQKEGLVPDNSVFQEADTV